MTTLPIPDHLKGIKTELVDSVFATGPDGRIYEIPNAEALKYAVTPARAKELGHLPILPYTDLRIPGTESVIEEVEVRGGHAVPPADDGSGFHRDWLFGTYRWLGNGCYYKGVHRHPFGYHDADTVDVDNG